MVRIYPFTLLIHHSSGLDPDLEISRYTVTWKTTPEDDPNGHDARPQRADTCDHAHLRSCEIVMEAVGFRQSAAPGSSVGKDLLYARTGWGSNG